MEVDTRADATGSCLADAAGSVAFPVTSENNVSAAVEEESIKQALEAAADLAAAATVDRKGADAAENSANWLCLGLDFGVHSSVLASCIWQKLSTATVECNALANRSTPTSVAFDGKLRLVGEEAEAKASSNQLNTITHLPLWLGVHSTESLEHLQRRMPFSAFPVVSFDVNRNLFFHVSFDGEEVKVPVLLLLAHFLKTLTGFANTGSVSGFDDGAEAAAVGVALPASADATDYAAVWLAAGLAKLPGYCVGLGGPTGSSDSTSNSPQTHMAKNSTKKNTAVTRPLLLSHADALLNCWCCRHLPQVFYDLKDLLQGKMQQQSLQEQRPEPTEQEKVKKEERVVVLLVDVGFAEISVQVAELTEEQSNARGSDQEVETLSDEQQQQQQGQQAESSNTGISVKRLALTVDKELGTVDIVNAVANEVCRVIRQKHPEEPPVQPHSKRALRLFAASQRAVKDLSGLSDTTLSLEGFLSGEQDFFCSFSRDQFEALCGSMKSRLHALVERALQQSGAADIIAGVDVVGGGSRIPWVQETLLEALASTSLAQQQQLRRTLDGSSSVAVGAALAAAGMRSYVQQLLNERELQLQQPLEKLRASVDLQALRELGEKFSEVEAAELSRCTMRNNLESYLLQMQSALQSGPHRELLQAAVGPFLAAAAPDDGNVSEQQQQQQQKPNCVAELLETQEHWLLDHPEATEDEYRRRYEAIQEELHACCPAYFAAVAEAKQQKDAELAAAATGGVCNNGRGSAAAPDGLTPAAGGGGSVLDRDMDVKLPNSQSIKRAKKNKDEGNELFRDGNTEMAVQRYVKALQYVGKLYDMSPQENEEAGKLKLACNLNLAQAYIRLATAGSANVSSSSSATSATFLNKAVACCDAALQVESKNLKALYRRALANERLRDFEAAQRDTKEALAVAPDDEDLQRLRDRLDRQLKLQKEKAKKMYAKMFA